MNEKQLDRRRFLGRSTGVVAAAWATPSLLASELPPVDHPRATSGDNRHEPDWSERLTVTVGPDKADIVGNTEKAIQAAVDYAARWGNGSVKILPGEYRFRNSVFLPSDIRIVGSGQDAVLIKEESLTAKLVADSDWFDQEITFADASGLKLGDGVFISVAKPGAGGVVNLKRTLVARDGNRFKLDRALRKNVWLSGEPSCTTSFPLFSGENIENVVIEDLTFDGNRANNVNLNGNYGGCIWLQDCNQMTMRGLTLRNYNGDGISWQICHDVVVENCHSVGNTDLGLHPGSGSQRPLIRDNRLERNGIGIFWCWGVKYGLAENNKIVDSVKHGMTIGHNDTDNVIRNNEILNSGIGGILFREDNRGVDFWANRNVLEKNRIVDNGGDEGIAIDVLGKTKDVVIAGNEIVETRKSASRIGIRIGADASNVRLSNNTVKGFAKAVEDLRT
ncbi:MAG: hypothetical protein GXP26_08075 [Planctomycetes bacterium]|nr:hypothetical protein [Planctomycetota bacterium]